MLERKVEKDRNQTCNDVSRDPEKVELIIRLFKTFIISHKMAIDTAALLASFKENGGWYDERIFGLKPYDNMGIGAVALEQIKVTTAASTELS